MANFMSYIFYHHNKKFKVTTHTSLATSDGKQKPYLHSSLPVYGEKFHLSPTEINLKQL